MSQHNNAVNYLNQVFAKLAGWSIRHRWLVFTSSLAVLFASLMLAENVRMNNSFDAYFNADDPAYNAYLDYRDNFGSDEIAYLIYDASTYPDGVFDLKLMQTIAELGEELEQRLPFVKEVKTIANTELISPTEDGIDILKLSDEFPQRQAELLVFADKFMQKPMYVGSFVSPDRKYGAIRIDMEKSSIDPIEQIRLDPNGGDGLENVYPQVTQSALDEVLAQDKFKQIKFYISGDVPLNSAYNRTAMDDMALTGSVSLVLIALLLLYFFGGSILGVVGPLAVVSLSVLITVGVIGLFGWDMDMMFAMVPTLLIAIGIAQAVHIISEFRIYYARSNDRRQAIEQTLRLVGAPCLLTSITTAAGFLALSFSPIKTIAHMSVYTSIAVMATFFLSITLLSFFLSFGKQKPHNGKPQKTNNAKIKQLLIKIAEFNIRYPKQILVAAAIAFALAFAGIAQVKVDSNFLLDFNAEAEIRQHTEFVDNTMGGTGSLVYLFKTEDAEGIKNPAVLQELDRFQQFVKQQNPLVQKTYSIVDLLKDLNQSFHNGDPAYYRIPASRELIAQYLLVYEISGGKELSNFVSSDYTSANLEIRTQMVNSSEIAQLKMIIDGYQQQQPLEHSHNEFTGIGALWIELMDYITQSQLQGVLLAFSVIAVLMCLLFRSMKIGLISMIPNIAPSIFVVGLMGWVGISLDYMKLLIAPIAIGIAVDDTIHLLTRFYHEFQQRKNYQQALVAAMADVGRALVITSVVLVAGFSAYALSQMDSQFWFGMLLSATIIVALIADFLILPALILIFKPFGPEEKTVAN